MTETDTENRRRLGEREHDVETDAGAVRGAGARRNEDMRGCHDRDLFERDRIVADDSRIRPQLAEVLHEVVGERIVVVDDENHGPEILIRLRPGTQSGPGRAFDSVKR